MRKVWIPGFGPIWILGIEVRLDIVSTQVRRSRTGGTWMLYFTLFLGSVSELATKQVSSDVRDGTFYRGNQVLHSVIGK